MGRLSVGLWSVGLWSVGVCVWSVGVWSVGVRSVGVRSVGEGLLPVLVCDKVDGDAQVAVSTGSANPVEVSLRVFRKVKVDDNVHCLYVYPSSEQICKRRYQSVAFLWCRKI